MDYETKMVLDGAAGDLGDGGICFYRRRSGEAAVELAAATAVRLAVADLLAGLGVAGSGADSFRKARRPTRESWSALWKGLRQEDEPGRSREIPEGDGGGVRDWCGSGRE